MDVIAIIYGIAVGIVAIVGLYKAYKNDGKITREEIDAILDDVENLKSNQDNKQS